MNQQKILKNHKPSLAKALMRQFFWPNILLGVICLLEVAILRVYQPILQGRIIRYLIVAEKSKFNDRNAVLGQAILFVLSRVASIFVNEIYEQYSMILGMRARVACCSLLYRKV